MILLLLALGTIPVSRQAASQSAPASPTTTASPATPASPTTSGSQAASDSQPPLPSPTVFSTPLGSSQAQLELTGSWNTTLSGSLGFGLDTAGGGLFPTTFPGMTEGFNFQQVPNLDISLRLLDRYFFKTSFVDTTASPTTSLPLGLSTFVLGYDGKPGEFLQSVRLGNTDVNMGSYDFLSFPDASTSSLGASATFQAGNGTYQAMIRYEPAALHERVFVGHNQITDQRLAPGAYLNGQYFVLPDANVQNLTVYIEDGTGTIPGSDGHLYRIAGPNDVVVNNQEGTIAFRKPLVGRALVYYTVNGTPVGSSSLGKSFLPQVQSLTPTLTLDLSAAPTQFQWSAPDPYVSGTPIFSATSQVAINGQNALLIYSPGQFSPFQADNVYPLGSTLPSANTTVTAALVPNGADGIAQAGTGSQGAAGFLSLPNGQGLRVSVDSPDQNFTVIGFTQSGTQPTVDPRSIAARYPFTSLAGIYASGVGRAPQDTKSQVLLRMATPVPDYQLDTYLVKGSVKVLRNGRSETNFTVDYTTGIVSFGVPIADSDVLLFTYRTLNVTKPGGDLLFGLGADFALSPSLNLDIGAGLRWAVFSGSYSTVQGTNTGSALLTAGLHYNENKTEGLRGSIEAGISLSSPDTTGTFQLFGMEGDGQSIPMTDGGLFPSSIPGNGIAADASTEFAGTPAASFSFTKTDRGELIYEDYHLYTSGGPVLEPITWPLPASQQYPYTAGSYTGPYPVYNSSLGTVMVMNYRMNPTQDWVGAQVPLPSAPEDLSGAESISFQISSALPSTDITAYLQIGSIGENLDGTSTLESSGSNAVKAFPFNDSGTILTTTGGGSPKTGGLYSSEDTNGNGLLDLENSSLVVTKQIPAWSSSGWTTVQFNLTPADRAMLANANAIRIVLVDTAGTTLASTFQISGFSISKAPFSVSAASTAVSGDITAQEVSDPQPGGKQLEDLFPEVKTTFHSAGQPQKVLDINWSYPTGTATTPAWTLTGYPNAVSTGIYQDLVFYLLTASTSAASTFTINLTNQNGQGVHAMVPLVADDTWHKYSVDLSTGAITIDGRSTGNKATLDGGVSTYTTLTMTSSGATSGDIYVDEIHLSHAVVKLSAGATLDGAYSKTGVVARAFGMPVLSDLTVKEQASVTGPDFASGFASFPDSTAVSSYTQFAGTLPFGRLGLQFGVAATSSSMTLSGGHSLDVPIGPVTVGDSYSQTVEAGQMTFTRGDHIGVHAGSVSASVSDSATGFGPSLSQALQTNASVTPAGPFSASMNGVLTNQVDQFSPFSLDYFPNWIRSFELLAPVPESDALRSGSLQLNTRFGLGNRSGPTTVQLDLQPTASYQNQLTTSRIQTNVGGLTLSLPIVSSAASLEGLTITPSYSRTFSTTVGAPANTNFAQDFGTYGSAVAGASYFFESIPFAELFSANTLEQFQNATAGLQAAEYQPQVSLSVARQTGSYLRDLVLPSQMVLSLGRTLAREANTVTDALNWEVQYGTDAINLFGSAGAYPIFHFYRTEEIANNIDLKGTNTGLTSTVVQNLLSLYFAGNSRLQLDHRLSLAWNTTNAINTPAFQLTDQASVSFVYRPALHIVLPLVPHQLQAGSYLQNTETITFESTPDVTANGLQINLGHETDLILPGHGKISATAGFGVAENRLSADNRQILFGLQASVGAQLSF